MYEKHDDPDTHQDTQDYVLNRADFFRMTESFYVVIHRHFLHAADIVQNSQDFASSCSILAEMPDHPLALEKHSHV